MKATYSLVKGTISRSMQDVFATYTIQQDGILCQVSGNQAIFICTSQAPEKVHSCIKQEAQASYTGVILKFGKFNTRFWVST